MKNRLEVLTGGNEEIGRAPAVVQQTDGGG